jgi:hypothetical protein
MPVTKTLEETIHVTGTCTEWFDRCVQAIKQGGFKNIRADDESYIADADFNSFITLGSIRLVLTEEAKKVEIAIRITAAVDNIWAYFWEPRQKILRAFKSHLDVR